LPLALLEAMSCGAAVVGTDIPGIAELVDDGVNGLLVPVGSPPELAERILEARARRDELGARARETVERSYSERAIGARLGELVVASTVQPTGG
jgi:glycosyltransferase involved in cell wall biosynthesis